MGVGRRILDLARANLNALMDRAARADLEERSEAELTAELERRRRERASQDAERHERLAAEAAARERASARPPDPRARGARRREHEAGARSARLTALYATLGLAPGATPEACKRAYRALMREHHPDRHAGDPRGQRAASDRAAAITTAYAELEALLAERR